jgi:hypothetical protein
LADRLPLTADVEREKKVKTRDLQQSARKRRHHGVVKHFLNHEPEISPYFDRIRNSWRRSRDFSFAPCEDAECRCFIPSMMGKLDM